MKKSDVIRAWRDEEFRAGLSAAERAALPAHPAGLVDFDDEALQSVAGGCCMPNHPFYTTPDCSTTCLPPGYQCY